MDLKDREKLEKLLNMLGSEFEGERANAGMMIKKMADRYNVTPAELCLTNKGQADPQPTVRPGWSRHAYAGTPGAEAFRRAANAYKDREEQAARAAAWNQFTDRARRAREEAQDMRREWERRQEEQEAFHKRREEELREAGRRAAQERAREAAKRRPKAFPGQYFGLLARLKTIYDEQFNGLEDWKIDFIEIVLGSCKADREMTRRQLAMAKAIIKYTEDSEETLI